jgi:hypothetical protein
MVAVPWLPLAAAVIVDEPAATPVTVNVADDWPAATATEPGTVATAVLLLVSVTVAPVVAESVTVPCAEPPGAMLPGLMVTPETVRAVGVGVGAGLLLLHCTVASIEPSAAIDATMRCDGFLLNMATSL